MSPDDRREMEQLESLAAELTEAGRAARAVSSRRETPDPAFAARLRAQLLSGQPQAVSDLAAPIPLAPDRPLGAPELVPDRRWSAAVTPVSAAGAAAAGIAASAAGASPTPLPESGKRWRDLTVRDRTAEPIAVLAPAETPEIEPDGPADHVAVLRPKVTWRFPTRIQPSRWVAVGLAASIAIATLFAGTTLMFPAGPTASVQLAVATTLVRGGQTSPLVAGDELHQGDLVEVGSGGGATLAMGASFVRMAAGSDLRLDGLDPAHIVLNQLAGRVYHRVSVGGRGDYTVATASVKWVATGSAFDLNREVLSSGGEQVRGLALLDGLDLTGPQLAANLSQGQSAVVELAAGSPAGAPSVAQIGLPTLADGWLVQNARLDAISGLDLGELAVDVSPTPVPTTTPLPSLNPTKPPTDVATATQTAEPTVSPTASPTHKPTPKPTRKPTPKPTGPLYLGKLTIVHNGNGTFSFSWPKYAGEGFTYYKLVYGPAGTMPVYGKDGFGYWACNETRDANSWTGSIEVGDYAVRLQVIDESSGNVVIRAQTGVVHLKVVGSVGTLPPTQNLGSLGVHPDGDGKYTFTWTAYSGGQEFSYYKLVYVAWGGNPSYLNGDPYWAVPGTGDTSTGSIAVGSGDWAVRIQAIGYPFGKAFVYGETGVFHLTVP